MAAARYGTTHRLGGDSPKSGIKDPRKDVYEAMTKVYEDANDALENFLFLFYGPTETSRTAGISSIKQILDPEKSGKFTSSK